MSRRVLSSSLLGVLLLGLALACGSRTTRNNGGGAGSPNAGGSAAMPSGGTSSGGGYDSDCPGSPMRCLDSSTVQYCEGTMVRGEACAEVMAAQGIVSNGCLSDAQGAGCTVDAFMDPECEQGAPVFALCEGLTEEHLVDTYVACFQNLSGATDVIPCYREFVDPTGMTVDCVAAQVACALPPP